MMLASTRMNQFPALILAISHNAVVLCEQLLNMGWCVNEVRRKDGCTPVHAAVLLRNYGVVKMLIKEGAAVAMRDNLGNTPLMK